MSLGRAMHQKPGEPGRNAGGRGEAEPEAVRDEARTARHATGSPGRDGLLAQALAKANMEAAWKRVKSNRGSAGVDGLSIAETADSLRAHWPRIRESLLEESYRPAPVRRVQIPKPDGGVRELGIPTVTDRLIQQALLQVLQRRIDPTFSEHSYGFRPGRRAHDAVLDAQRYVQDGYRVVVARSLREAAAQLVEAAPIDLILLDVTLPDGEVILSLCFHAGECDRKVVGVRCSFDGSTLAIKETGPALSLPIKRGLLEPSVTRHGERIFLTMRAEDERGYVAVSEDGLHYSTPKPWCWEDGTEIGNYNTQQHWLVGGGDLYLVYTRRGANNDHVFRHRAPLFIAQVDTDRLCLLRASEQIVVPEKGARLGNFGVTYVSDHESWVVVSEWMQTNPPNPSDCTVCERYGANNRLWLSRVKF